MTDANTSPSTSTSRLADGVLVINLDHRPERLEHFANMVRPISSLAGWERIAGVYGVDLPSYGQPPWFRNRERDKCWAGRAGCTLSHRKAIEYARDMGWQSVLILEDDIQLGDLFEAGVRNLLESAVANPKPWHAYFLGWSQQVGPSFKIHGLDEFSAVYQIFGCTGTFAYILKRESFEWILASLPTEKTIWAWTARHRAIDRWYARNLSKHLLVHALSPNLIGHYSSYSDVGLHTAAQLLMQEKAIETTDHLQPSDRSDFALKSAILRTRLWFAGLANWFQYLVKRWRGF